MTVAVRYLEASTANLALALHAPLSRGEEPRRGAVGPHDARLCQKGALLPSACLQPSDTIPGPNAAYLLCAAQYGRRLARNFFQFGEYASNLLWKLLVEDAVSSASEDLADVAR
jgi:hypothetical protein